MGAYAEVRSVEALAGAMTYRGETPASVARKVNAMFGTSAKPQRVSRQFVSRLRKGDDRRCRPELAEQIAAVLDLPVDSLFVMRGVRQEATHNVQAGAA